MYIYEIWDGMFILDRKAFTRHTEALKWLVRQFDEIAGIWPMAKLRCEVHYKQQ